MLSTRTTEHTHCVALSLSLPLLLFSPTRCEKQFFFKKLSLLLDVTIYKALYLAEVD